MVYCVHLSVWHLTTQTDEHRHEDANLQGRLLGLALLALAILGTRLCGPVLQKFFWMLIVFLMFFIIFALAG